VPGELDFRAEAFGPPATPLVDKAILSGILCLAQASIGDLLTRCLGGCFTWDAAGS